MTTKRYKATKKSQSSYKGMQNYHRRPTSTIKTQKQVQIHKMTIKTDKTDNATANYTL